MDDEQLRLRFEKHGLLVVIGPCCQIQAGATVNSVVRFQMQTKPNRHGTERSVR